MKTKVITDNTNEIIKVSWDGTRFTVFSSRKGLGNRLDVVFLNPKEMLDLIEFAGKLGGEEDDVPFNPKSTRTIKGKIVSRERGKFITEVEEQ